MYPSPTPTCPKPRGCKSATTDWAYRVQSSSGLVTIVVLTLVVYLILVSWNSLDFVCLDSLGCAILSSKTYCSSRFKGDFRLRLFSFKCFLIWYCFESDLASVSVTVCILLQLANDFISNAPVGMKFMVTLQHRWYLSTNCASDL